ncbi:hypothetical protein RB594_007526 [Gaeumannomyces avenae]
MASPPKPWERAGATAASPISSLATSPNPAIPATTTATAATASGAPALPAFPTSLANTVNQAAAAYSRPLGASPYGAGYSSPYGGGMYSRLGGYGGYGGGLGGGYGGGMYGGLGGYGGGMYGGGMYGGGMGGGMGGAQGDPNDPNSLTNRFGMSTQQTFQMLEGIVGAFGGFAQMLESTYMATHSSFFAMVSVAEQFGNLREALGSVLGIFTLMRWIRNLIARLTGRPLPADVKALTPAAFARFEGRSGAANLGADGRLRPSRKPLFFFVLAAFGLPFLMSKAIRSMAASQEEERRRLEVQSQQLAVDPTQLEFCRVLYDFDPTALAQQGGALTAGVDIAVKKGDFVAVLGRTDPNGNPSEWWRCRSRDGRIGYLPANFLEVMQRQANNTAARAAIKDSAATVGGESTRTSSMTSNVSAPTNMAVQKQAPPVPLSKMGDISPESFQKSQFYS